MTITKKISYSSSAILFFMALFVGTAVWFSQKNAIIKQKDLLLSDLQKQIEIRVEAHKKILQFIFTNDRRTTGVAAYVANNAIIRNGLRKGQLDLIGGELKSICLQNDIDFIVIFDHSGVYYSSNPANITHKTAEKHFRDLPHFQTFQDDFHDEDTTKESRSVGSYEKWTISTFSDYMIDIEGLTGIVDLAVDAISGNNIYEIIGYVLVGKNISSQSGPLKDHWSMTGHFSMLTDGVTPISWVGLPGQKKDITLALDSPSTHKRGQDDLTLQFFETSYHANYFPLKNFFGEVVASVYTGESNEALNRQIDRIEQQALESIDQLRIILLLLILAAFFVSVIVMSIIGRKIAAPIVAASKAAQKIAAGDLNHSLPSSVDDETRLLNRSLNEMISSLHNLRNENERIQDVLTHEATHDTLTGVLSRGAILDVFNRELARAKREKSDVFVGLCDIDFFKRVNDNYGHQVGDDVLCGFTKSILNIIRPYDFLGRYGGEEFLIVITQSAKTAGEEFFERIRASIAKDKIITRSSEIDITVSIGVSCSNGYETADEIIAAADKALYKAKDNGRNLVVFADRIISSDAV